MNCAATGDTNCAIRIASVFDTPVASCIIGLIQAGTKKDDPITVQSRPNHNPYVIYGTRNAADEDEPPNILAYARSFNIETLELTTVVPTNNMDVDEIKNGTDDDDDTRDDDDPTFVVDVVAVISISFDVIDVDDDVIVRNVFAVAYVAV